MKKYISGMLAILLALGFSAFSGKHATSSSDLDFRWAKTNDDGTLVTPLQIFEGTEAEARAEFTCPVGTPNFCAKAVDEDDIPIPGGPELRKN